MIPSVHFLSNISPLSTWSWSSFWWGGGGRYSTKLVMCNGMHTITCRLLLLVKMLPSVPPPQLSDTARSSRPPALRGSTAATAEKRWATHPPPSALSTTHTTPITILTQCITFPEWRKSSWMTGCPPPIYRPWCILGEQQYKVTRMAERAEGSRGALQYLLVAVADVNPHRTRRQPLRATSGSHEGGHEGKMFFF